MTAAKRHHTVPQFYLRGFANRDQIATVRLPGEHRFLQSVTTAASENRFHTVPGHQDGPEVFEELLAEIEGETAPVFEAVASGTWPLGPADRMALAAFITLQAVRGPEQRRNMAHVAAQMIRLEIGYGGRAGVKKWVKRNHGISVTDEQAEELWQQATQPEGPPIRIPAIAHIEQIGKLVEELLPYISGRPWTLIRFDKRSLITSDTPVGLVPRPNAEPWSGVGFMTAWGITYPLTRKLGLLLSDPMVFIDHHVPVEDVRAGKMDGEKKGTTELEKFFNGSTVGSASKFLYHHPQDERFVPTVLPEPNPVTLRMSGPETFSGEPLFESKDAN